LPISRRTTPIRLLNRWWKKAMPATTLRQLLSRRWNAAANLEEKPKEDQVLKLLKSVLNERAGWNEVVRSGAIAGLQLKTSVAALDLILEYTRLGLPKRCACQQFGHWGPSLPVKLLSTWNGS